MVSRPKRKKLIKFILIVSQRATEQLDNAIDGGPFEVMLGQISFIKPQMEMDEANWTEAHFVFYAVVSAITDELDPENPAAPAEPDIEAMPGRMQDAIDDLED